MWINILEQQKQYRHYNTSIEQIQSMIVKLELSDKSLKPIIHNGIHRRGYMSYIKDALYVSYIDNTSMNWFASITFGAQAPAISPYFWYTAGCPVTLDADQLQIQAIESQIFKRL